VDQLAFQAVLEGQYEAPPGCTPATAKLLSSLQCPSNIHDIDLGGVEEFNQGWKKVREQPASSPLKVHFGHYIAGTFNPHITIINAKMAELPQSRGKALRHWTKGLNVMLEKIPGNCNLDKL